MLVSICGTPGVGKTTISTELKRSGFDILNEKNLIEKLGLFEEVDRETGELLVDTEVVRRGFREYFGKTEKDTIVEGHLSYLAPYDLLVILRLDPLEIRSRLQRRNYSREKIEENVEAEAVGSISVNALLTHPGNESTANIVERDITDLETSVVVEWILLMICAWRGKEIKTLSFYGPGKVDWLEAYTPWS